MKRAVVALVVVPAGFLARLRIGEIAHAVFLDDHRRGRFALGDAHIGVERLERARGRVVPQDHARGRDDLIERGQELVGQALHARGRDLNHDRIAEAIDDDARQAVAFGVHKAVIGLGEERFAHGQGAPQPFGKEGACRSPCRAAPTGGRRSGSSS